MFLSVYNHLKLLNMNDLFEEKQKLCGANHSTPAVEGESGAVIVVVFAVEIIADVTFAGGCTNPGVGE